MASVHADALGMVTGVVMVFDAANGVWYLVDGGYISAAFCAAAFLPIVGDTATAAKLGTKGLKVIDEAAGRRKKLRQMWRKQGFQLQKVLQEGIRYLRL